MARYRKKKALYEVIRKSSQKVTPDKVLDKDEKVVQKPELKEQTVQAVIEKPVLKKTEVKKNQMPKWAKGPKMLQFNEGKVEIYMPYNIMIVVVMVFLLAFFMVYRLGRVSVTKLDAQIDNVKILEEVQKPVQEKVVVQNADFGPVYEQNDDSPQAEDFELSGNHIVIQAFRVQNDLVPVKQYYASNGIDTVIQKIGSWYYLITVKSYESTKDKNSQGYNALQSIRKLGEDYKAPQGYESFGPKPFNDAYPKNFTK